MKDLEKNSWYSEVADAYNRVLRYSAIALGFSPRQKAFENCDPALPKFLILIIDK